MVLLLVAEFEIYWKFKGLKVKLKGTRVFNDLSAYFRRTLVSEHGPKWHRAEFGVHQMKLMAVDGCPSVSPHWPWHKDGKGPDIKDI